MPPRERVLLVTTPIRPGSCLRRTCCPAWNPTSFTHLLLRRRSVESEDCDKWALPGSTRATTPGRCCGRLRRWQRVGAFRNRRAPVGQAVAGRRLRLLAGGCHVRTKSTGGRRLAASSRLARRKRSSKPWCQRSRGTERISTAVGIRPVVVSCSGQLQSAQCSLSHALNCGWSSAESRSDAVRHCVLASFLILFSTPFLRLGQ